MKWNELGESLKSRGQLDAIHRTKFGIAGGWKRYRECLRLGIEPKFVEHPEIETIEQHLQLMRELGNVVLTSKEKRQYVKDRIIELEKAGVEISEIIKILRDITGYSRMQLYRLIPDDIKEKYGLMVTNVTMTNFMMTNVTMTNKPTRGMKKCMVCPLAQNNKSLEEELARIREQYKKALESIEEVISTDEFRLTKAISLFLQKHPNKEFTPDGKIMEKLTQ
jgi:hypothetical protein